MNEIAPTPAIKAMLLAKHGDGLHRFSVCPACGQIEWVGTQRGGTTDVVLIEQPLSDANCSRCAEIFRRTPEILFWVLAVVDYQIRRHTQREAAARDAAPTEGGQP